MVYDIRYDDGTDAKGYAYPWLLRCLSLYNALAPAFVLAI